ncbi:MAG: dTMP kinase, partial [Vibrio sp.]|nr:dTMP kinase [Vibrio sp.]
EAVAFSIKAALTQFLETNMLERN